MVRKNHVYKIAMGASVIALAGIGTFAVAEYASKPLEKEKVVVAATDISENSLITESMLTTVYRSKDALNDNSLTDMSYAIGKYADANIYASDIVNVKDLVDANKSFDSYVLSMPQGKEAFSIGVTEMANIVSAHIAKGDIVKVYSYTDESASTEESPLTQYIKVIGVFDKDGNEIMDTSSYQDASDLPTTVALEVTNKQIDVINYYINNNSIHLSLVARADEATTEAYLNAQEKVLEGTIEK